MPPLRRALWRYIAAVAIVAALVGFALGRLSVADCGEALDWAVTP